jgi:hypothetical protein
MSGGALLVSHCPTWHVTERVLTFIQCVSFVVILNNAAVMGYLRGCRFPARISYPVQGQDKNQLFEVGNFFVRLFAAGADIVCYRDQQYILVAHCT